ncbi:MAG: hypothetical protein A2Y58_05285 [Chloroflexi bacterium RBG_13_51_52]|nr:MAG: hypothetical protein A2Y58_05285 [Chloroflexi bacterium RBG_13_51_52]
MIDKIFIRSVIISLIIVILSIGMPSVAGAAETAALPYTSPEIEIAKGGTWTTDIQVTSTKNLFVTLQKTSLVSYGNSWDGELSIESGGRVIASTESSHDSMVQLVNPQPGNYTIKVQADQTGSGIVSARTALPQLTFGDWVIGTIHCSYGSTWYQLEVPNGLEGIYFEAEAMGLWSQFDIYYQEYREGEHWVSQQGVYTSEEIRRPSSGTYIVQFTDSAMLWTGNDWSSDQSRDVLIKVSTMTKYSGVYFPLGEISFADEAIDYQPGDRADYPCNNPSAAFGPPDYYDDKNELFCSLGDGGTYTVKFTDNYLIDVEGYDLYIFEIGAVEPFRVEISQDGTRWIDLGVVEGQPTELDIHGKVQPGEKFSYVKMTDVNAALTIYPWAGADIDAVGAIGARETSFAPTGYQPLINSLSPAGGGNTGPVTMEIWGGWLDANGTVALSRPGYQDIVAQDVQGSPDLTMLTASFDLAGKEPGDWTLTVANPDGKTAIATSSFSIEQGGKSDIWVEILGRDKIRIDRPQTFSIRYGNRGNVDVEGVPLWIGGIPSGAEVKLNFTVSQLDDTLAQSGIDASEIPDYYDIDGQIVVPLIVPIIPAGSSGSLSIQITVPRDYQPFQLRAWTNPPFFQSKASTKLVNCLITLIKLAANLTPGEACVVSVFETLSKTFFNLIDKNNYYSYSHMLLSMIAKCGAVLTGVEAARIIYVAIDALLTTTTLEGCIEAFTELSESTLPVEPVDSTTPEDKYGPAGFDPPGTSSAMRQRFVSISQNLYYKVEFWNKEDARAPAYDVLVEDQLDADLDWSSFRFEEIGFLDWTVELEPCQYFNVNVDTRPAQNLIVNIEGGFNPETGKIKWLFRSLDPDTMNTPDDPMAGFLPPITQSGNEVGWVCYSVYPKSDLANGTKLENQAFVEFDHQGDLLNHPAPKEGPFINTIDSTAPVSAVTGKRDGDQIALTWEGDDHNGSGVKRYTIYVSKDGGNYEPWLIDTAETSGVYLAESESTYAFYSVAVDNTGNEELPPDNPDVTLSPTSSLLIWFIIGGAVIVIFIVAVVLLKRRR